MAEEQAPQTQDNAPPKAPRKQNLDFTPKHNWADIIPKAKAMLAAGITQIEAAKTLGVHNAYLSQKLGALKRKEARAQALKEGQAATASNTPQGTETPISKEEGTKNAGSQALTDNGTTQQNKPVVQAPSNIDPEEAARVEAGETLRRIARGEVDAKPGQVQALKLLRDSHQAETEANPYAGTPEPELAERCLTLAASVLGVHQCAVLLRDLARAGQADVTGMTPEVLAMLGQVAESPQGPENQAPETQDPNEVIPGRV